MSTPTPSRLAEGDASSFEPPADGSPTADGAGSRRGRQRVTQLQVAAAAGVHNTTVSLALRNSPCISPATRERIQAIAEQLGYRPDPALRALAEYRRTLARPRRTETLAYITRGDSRWGWRDVPAEVDRFRGAERRASACGYELQHFWLAEPGLNARRLSSVLFHRGISGLLFASPWLQPEETVDFDWSRSCGVILGEPRAGAPLHRVAGDPAADLGRALAAARQAGYRRPGLVLPQSVEASTGSPSRSGAENLPTLLLPPPGRMDAATGGATLGRWLERVRPDVILGPATFVLPHVARAGLTVPGDVAFADPSLDVTDGSVAGMLRSDERLGEIAADLLIAQLQQNQRGLPDFPTTTLVQGAWRDGTTLPRRPADPHAEPSAPTPGKRDLLVSTAA